MRVSWVSADPKSDTDGAETGQRQTERKSQGGGGRDQRDAATSQGTARTAC